MCRILNGYENASLFYNLFISPSLVEGRLALRIEYLADVNAAEVVANHHFFAYCQPTSITCFI